MKCFLIVFGILLSAEMAFSQSQSTGNSRFRFDTSVGYSTQDFAGVTGADFTKINTMAIGAGLFYRMRRYNKLDLGLQYSLIPKLSISPFVFSDNNVGTYTFKIQQYQFLMGFAIKKVRAHLIFGMERIPWSGTPALAQTSATFYNYGAQLSFDAYRVKKLRVPILIRYLKKGERANEFGNFPDDSVVVSAGAEIVVTSGASFEFL